MRRLPLLAIALLALAPAPALASGKSVLRDCKDGAMDQPHSQADYSSALGSIPADLDEYTDCRDLIRRAQLDSAGRGTTGGGGGVPVGGAGGGGGGTPGAPQASTATLNVAAAKGVLASASPVERAALERLSRGSGPPIEVDGRTVTPGAAGFTANAVHNALPGSLVAVLVLLGTGMAAIAALVLGTRVRGRRQR